METYADKLKRLAFLLDDNWRANHKTVCEHLRQILREIDPPISREERAAVALDVLHRDNRHVQA